MNQVIEIIVAPGGSTSLRTKGFAGSKCMLASRFLEQSLGIRASDERTTEFYAPVEQAETLPHKSS